MSGKKTDDHTYILVLEMGAMEVGHHYNNTLHCTLVPWFYLPVDYQAVLHLLGPAINKTAPFTITSDKAENFGDDLDLPVFTVIKDQGLSDLHNKLIKIIKRQSGSFSEPQYTGAGWRPHVTTQGAQEFPAGKTARIGAAYLIEALGQDRETAEKIVRARLEFGGRP